MCSVWSHHLSSYARTFPKRKFHYIYFYVHNFFFSVGKIVDSKNDIISVRYSCFTMPLKILIHPRWQSWRAKPRCWSWLFADEQEDNTAENQEGSTRAYKKTPQKSKTQKAARKISCKRAHISKGNFLLSEDPFYERTLQSIIVLRCRKRAVHILCLYSVYYIDLTCVSHTESNSIRLLMVKL